MQAIIFFFEDILYNNIEWKILQIKIIIIKHVVSAKNYTKKEFS